MGYTGRPARYAIPRNSRPAGESPLYALRREVLGNGNDSNEDPSDDEPFLYAHRREVLGNLTPPVSHGKFRRGGSFYTPFGVRCLGTRSSPVARNRQA